jgi:uncharacterized cupredoxin-like copper-binding protein
MTYRFPVILPVVASLALAGLSLAAGTDENHAHGHGTRTPGQTSGHPAAKYTGHAAALGKPAALSEATRTVAIDMADGMRFTPQRIVIKQGDTVRFVARNQGQVKHEMILGTIGELRKHAALMLKFPEMEHDDPNAVSVAPGKTGEFAWTFSKPGSFDFACLIPGHFEAGMKGRIIVKK